MIPPPDVDLDAITSRRWQLTKLAAALHREGVPATTLHTDIAEGVALATKETS